MATVKRRIEGLEIFLTVMLGGFALAFLIRAEEFGETAALFPQMIAGLSLALLATILCIRFAATKGAKATPPVAGTESLNAPDAVSWPAALVLQAAYVSAIIIIGFPIATVLYLLSSAFQMGYRRWAVLVVYAVLMTITVSLAFVYLFNVRLPEVLLSQWLLTGR